MGSKQVNQFNISGKVLFAGLPIYYTENLSKRVLVIEAWIGRYRQEIAFDFVNENMPLLDGIRNDMWVNVDFVLRGKKHIQKDGKARWFTNLEANSVTVED